MILLKKFSSARDGILQNLVCRKFKNYLGPQYNQSLSKLHILQSRQRLNRGSEHETSWAKFIFFLYFGKNYFEKYVNFQ